MAEKTVKTEEKIVKVETLDFVGAGRLRGGRAGRVRQLEVGECLVIPGMNISQISGTVGGIRKQFPERKFSTRTLADRSGCAIVRVV